MTQSPSPPDLIHKWETRYPEEWALCYPKHYETIHGYTSPKHLALNLIEFCAPQQRQTFHLKPEARNLNWFAAASLVNLRVPIFFVAPDLLAAVRMSVPPSDLDWVNMHLPFESAAFALPTRSLVHATRGEVSYLWYTRLRKGQPYPVFPGVDPVGITDDDCFVLFAPCMESANDKIGVSQIFLGKQHPTASFGTATDLDGPEDYEAAKKVGLIPDDLKLLHETTTLLFNLLLVLDARKELMESGHWTGKKTHRGLEFWTPNVLGRKYVLPKPSPDGGGVTPRMHWRRGHVRLQPYGKRHSLRRPQWIEPTLVAAM